MTAPLNQSILVHFVKFLPSFVSLHDISIFLFVVGTLLSVLGQELSTEGFV